jgi:4-amino-4-deoxy-L-arabinose transferase-like glycosyltransferase
MKRHARWEVLIVISVIAVASFFRFYHLVKYAPDFYSAVFGVLTVLGLYLLARELFDWRVGAVSSLLLAISFWHVNFSRNGFQAIILPFVLVYLFYFLWRGLKHSQWSGFFWAGVFGGLGFYTYTPCVLAPVIVVVVFVNYWLFLKKKYAHENYEHARNRFLGGFCLMAIVAFSVALPILVYLFKNSNNFMELATQSVITQIKSFRELGNNTIHTLGMFTFTGDTNPIQNIPGEPMLGWPVAILFAIGFLKELYHWLRRKHGHLSPVHTLMFAWFFVMLLPGFFSAGAPNAMITIGVLPIVMIFSARGLLWLLNASKQYEEATHPWERGRIFVAPVLACVALLFALGFYEYHRYFNIWAPSQLAANKAIDYRFDPRAIIWHLR